MRHDASVQRERVAHGDAVAVEITYVIVSGVLALATVIGAEWITWRLFGLTSESWQRVGLALLAATTLALVVRGVRVLIGFRG